MKLLSRNALKYIAIVAMLIDHMAMVFAYDYPLIYGIMRLIGRVTAPIMCFFIAEGFFYTRSKYKYGIRLLFFALISQFAYTLFNHGTFLTYEIFTEWNVIFTLFIGFCVLLAYEKISNRHIKWSVIILLCALSYLGDWMIIAPIWILCFYTLRDNNKKRFITFSILVIAEVSSCIPFIINYGEIWQAGVFLTIPLLLLYNGKKGSESPFNKWAFYLFYPLHLFLLGIINWIMIINL